MTCSLMEKLLKTNDQFPIPNSHLTRFHARTVPDISVQRYIQRIVKYAPFPAEVLLTVLVYIDRLAARHSGFIINSFNIHRVLISTIVLSIKFHCDQLYTNKHYSKVGGITARELMLLEFDMLALLGYRIVVTNEELDLYYQRLVKMHTKTQPLHDVPFYIQEKKALNDSFHDGVFGTIVGQSHDSPLHHVVEEVPADSTPKRKYKHHSMQETDRRQLALPSRDRHSISADVEAWNRKKVSGFEVPMDETQD